MRDILYLFDIDGTLIDSTAEDDRCFIETFYELHEIRLDDVDWDSFEDVTDRGLCEDIFMKNLGRFPTEGEYNRVYEHFCSMISKSLLDTPEKMAPIPGARDFFHNLGDNGACTAIATGGWRKSADMKLMTAGFTYLPITMASSNDSRIRRSIMNIAIGRAQYEYQTMFEHVVYFGDGIWDARVCDEMGIPMIGIDIRNSNKLVSEKTSEIFADFTEREKIMQTIASVTGKNPD